MNKKIYLVIIIFAIAILATMITNIQREKIVMVESGDDISRIRINKNTIEDKDTIDDIVEIFKNTTRKKLLIHFRWKCLVPKWKLIIHSQIQGV
jgi:hypothetical protein